MKKLLLFVYSVLFASACAYAQQVPEKSNTIIITQADSIGLREKVMKVLSEKDYTTNSSKTAMTITTAAKTLKNGTRVNYYFQLKGSEILLTGKLPVAGQSGTLIVYQGKKGTPMMNGWEEMEKLAKALGGKVRYEIK